jgi:hypothetical protein
MIVYSTDPQGLEGRKQVKLLINSLKHERKLFFLMKLVIS